MPGFSVAPHSIPHAAAHPLFNEIHGGDSPHSSGSSKVVEKSAPSIVKSEPNPFTPSSSGLPTESRPMNSPMQDIKLSNDPRNFCVRYASENNGAYALYERDPETGAPVNTGKFVRPDGPDNWALIPSGLRGGGKSSSKQAYSRLEQQDSAPSSGRAAASSSSAPPPISSGNDGKSKFWVVKDKRGHTKPGDSSYDAYFPRYTTPYADAGKGTWPDHSRGKKNVDMTKQSFAYLLPRQGD